MATISRTGITAGGTIQPAHITNIIDALDGTTTIDIITTGSLQIDGTLDQGYLVTTIGDYSHAQGTSTITSGFGSHAEGYQTEAYGASSHAEGNTTVASGSYSHAEGTGTVARGNGSHADGLYTIASGSYQCVTGRYNTQGDTTSLFIVGNGTNNVVRQDAFKVRMSGSIVLPTTQSAAPAWTGTDGEIVPATVSGKYLLYMWMNGAWRSGSFV